MHQQVIPCFIFFLLLFILHYLKQPHCLQKNTYIIAPLKILLMTNQAIKNGSINDTPKPHFVLVPLLAQGHMIPMVDMARLIAERGVLVSFITTSVNAARIKPIIERVKTEGLPIRIIELKFPCSEVGLPEGCENIDLIPSIELYKPFFKAMTMLREPLRLYLREVNPNPSCMLIDYCHSWTAEIAEELNIPRIIFHGPSCFYILCMQCIRKHNIFKGVDKFKPVVVPELPQRIELSKMQAPGWFPSPDWEDIHNRVLEAEASADCTVVNSFREMEPEVIENYEKATGKRVWPVGPLSLCNRDATSKATRGDMAAVKEDQIVSWLDSKEPKSVLLVSFGSMVHNQPSQLTEIGCGLEASNKPFIWVIRGLDKCPEVETWMSEGFGKRTKERGLIIKGWAPQVLILSHPSIGGFMTHCGWNSALEALTAGVPMITWPHFADQFINEKFVVQVLKIGVSLQVKATAYFDGEEPVLLKKDEVEKAILNLMSREEEAEERRERVAEFSKKAKNAMEKEGSSYESLGLLIEYIKEYAKKKDPNVKQSNLLSL